jgi:hypothetical protein
MPARRLLSALAALVSLAAASRPAAAQHAVASSSVSATPITAAPAVRRVATYYVAGTRGDVGLPGRVTVSDSIGQLVANVQIIGERAPRAMVVTVIENDLVLQAETPRGLLTLVLEKQNDRSSARLRGRWALGMDRGPVKGRLLTT